MGYVSLQEGNQQPPKNVSKNPQKIQVLESWRFVVVFRLGARGLRGLRGLLGEMLSLLPKPPDSSDSLDFDPPFWREKKSKKIPK